MKWILWREYRLNRQILIAGAVLLLLPYLVALIVLWWPKTNSTEVRHVAEAFGIAVVYSLSLSQLTVAILGGNTFAGERADRSAEFIAYLPLSRPRLLGGKLSLAFSVTALIWGTNLLVLWILVSVFPDLRLRGDFHDGFQIASYVAITGLVFYGVSWLISSFQSSPTFAASGGLITPLLVFMGLEAAAWAIHADFEQTQAVIGFTYTIICGALAVVCFSTGTWYYLNRVEP